MIPAGGVPERCTSSRDWMSHRPGDLRVPATNAMLGLAARRGSTACGLPDAVDQAELDLQYAEWHVPRARRVSITRIPIGGVAGAGLLTIGLPAALALCGTVYLLAVLYPGLRVDWRSPATAAVALPSQRAPATRPHTRPAARV